MHFVLLVDLDRPVRNRYKVRNALCKDEEIGTTLKNKAVEWIKANKDKDEPFFLYMATTNIHHPFTPAPEFK